MLTSEIKQKIDNARNILVGKIPTPTGQVEQITLALVYKFMNDIDEQNQDLGGALKFFNGEYKKYAWKDLLDKSLSAYERVTSYGEGLDKMHLNPNLPQFFRNVFRGAFLPFRDPEVLTLFLKQIDEFQYGVNGDLGDAFEYLLQVMGTQGDAGQFLTPRHIINFIVSIVDPQKTDKILDPAVGTAGFLISAYQHLLKQNTLKGSNKPGSALTMNDRKRFANNFVGYDVSHDLVRLSLVNLYFHNFADPKIHEYDTLGNVDHWDDDFDCILTNPPFMTPKGGVKPHKKFSIQAKRSEVLFVDYIMEHLTPNGKAGIIVPEGIIFKSDTAYKALRKMMIDQNFLWGVISLPAGIFQPYAGVKTSILLLDRVLAKKTKNILFVKVENDGFDLGAQRRLIDKNDLPTATDILKRYKMSIQTGEPFESSNEEQQMASLVPIDKIGMSGDYNLSADRYKESVALVNQKWPMVVLGNICQIERGASPRPIDQYVTNDSSGVNWIKIGDTKNSDKYICKTVEKITLEGASKSRKVYVGDFVLSNSMSFGRPYIMQIEGCIHDGWLRLSEDSSKIDKNYMYYILGSSAVTEQFERMATGGVVRNLNSELVRAVTLPLPPLEVQQEIVLQLDSYQKIIDGAKQVVENYKPEIKIDPSWEVVELRGVCELISGQHIMSEDYNDKGTGVPYLTGPIDFGALYPNVTKWTTKPKTIAKEGDVLITVKGSGVGKLNILNISEASISRQLMAIRSLTVNKLFLYVFLLRMYDHFQREGEGSAIPGLDRNNILSIKIPLPPLDIQEQIVSRIEEEQELVDANKKLIQIYQDKIKEKIDEVWGEKKQ